MMHETLSNNVCSCPEGATVKVNTGRHMRPIKLLLSPYGYAHGSVISVVGNTQVLCSVTLVPGVPPFLRGKNEGWLTAEYALLPTATHVRGTRSSSLAAPNGRSVELSRFIGRVLRTAIDLTAFADATLTIDCDVLQADGGTRTAAISGAMAALMLAQKKLLEIKAINKPFIRQCIAAVSVAIDQGDRIIIDPTYADDSRAHADINFVFTRDGELIEVQGGAERSSIPVSVFTTVISQALCAVHDWFSVLDPYWHETERITVHKIKAAHAAMPKQQKTNTEIKKKAPLFSLLGRNIEITPA